MNSGTDYPHLGLFWPLLCLQPFGHLLLTSPFVMRITREGPQMKFRYEQAEKGQLREDSMHEITGLLVSCINSPFCHNLLSDNF